VILITESKEISKKQTCKECKEDTVEYDKYHDDLICKSCGFIVVSERFSNTCRVCKYWSPVPIKKDDKEGFRFKKGYCRGEHSSGRTTTKQIFKCFLCDTKKEYIEIVCDSLIKKLQTYECNCGLKFTVYNWKDVDYLPKCPKCLMDMSNNRLIK
jgi:hypothetical protein